ncbi:MAG: DUF1844 domain-containing protein [bacterium]
MADENNFDKDEALFLSIMYSFHAAAMQQMGKIANPFTGKIERDLDAVRGTIDVLVMFRKKTEGNLTDRERRVLTGLITELQLNYVDESKREPAAEEGEPAPEAEKGVAAEPTAEAEVEGEKVGAGEDAAAAEGEEEPAAKEEAEAVKDEEATDEKAKKKAVKKGPSPKEKKKES